MATPRRKVAAGYDLWLPRQIAQRLFPLPSQALGPISLIPARVIVTIAALMAMTDESLRVLVRLSG